MTNDRITELESKGFTRWTKGNIDRLYINATQLGLNCEYYKTGSISYAEFRGVKISNSQARRMKTAKTYIDINTGRAYSDDEMLLEAVKDIAGI